MTEFSPEQTKSHFTREERATLHRLADMFSKKDDRDNLRQLLDEGVTLKELILAYKTKHRAVAWLKAAGALIILGGAVWGTLKGLNLWSVK